MDGRDAINNGLKELEEQGYLYKAQIHYHGKIYGWAYVVFASPEDLAGKEVEVYVTREMFSSKKVDSQEVGTPKEKEKCPPVPPKEKEKGRKKDNIKKYNSLRGSKKVDFQEVAFSPELPKDNSLRGKKKVDSQEVARPPELPSQNTLFRPSISSHNKTLKERTATYLPYAKKLAWIIRQTKNIKTSPQKLLSWAAEIRKLVETDGATPQRIKAAIIWYRHNIGGQYVPVIESGESLRRKFINLESAMSREDARKPKEAEEDGFNIPGVIL